MLLGEPGPRARLRPCPAHRPPPGPGCHHSGASFLAAPCPSAALRMLVIVHVCVQIWGAWPWGEWMKPGSRAFPVRGDGVTWRESPGGLGMGPGTPAAGVWPEGEAQTPAAVCGSPWKARSPREACSLPRRPAPAASFLVADTAPVVVAWRILPCLSRVCCAYLPLGSSLPLWLWVAKCDAQSPALGPLEVPAIQRALQLGLGTPRLQAMSFPS